MSYIDNSYIMRMSYKFDMFVKKKDNLYNFRCPLCGDSKKNKTKSVAFDKLCDCLIFSSKLCQPN